MKITLNKQQTELPGREQLSVKELLAEKRYIFPLIVVRVNGRLVRKQDYLSTQVHDGDTVDAFHLTSGG